MQLAWDIAPYRIPEVVFEVSICQEEGGCVASWDDPAGGGIATQGDTFAELDFMIRDAVDLYFADRAKPPSIRWRFVDDPVLAIA